MVMFRMARQWSGAVPVQMANSGLGLEREALSLAMLWAADSRQTAEQPAPGAGLLSKAAAHAVGGRDRVRRGSDHQEHGGPSSIRAD